MQGKVYLVGGAVRDKLMGVEPKDYDYVVVGGSQQNLLDLGFSQVGKSFPVFLHPTTGYEYALARTERKTGLGYGGFEVHTDGVTIEQDLGRRDFTINAMALDEETGELIDPYGGAGDLREGVIRHVSTAFLDDPLRVLRAARFAARYNFRIASETIDAAKRVDLQDFEALHDERIFLELKKSSAYMNNFLVACCELEATNVIARVFTKWDSSWQKIPASTESFEVVLLAAATIASLEDDNATFNIYNRDVAMSLGHIMKMTSARNNEDTSVIMVDMMLAHGNGSPALDRLLRACDLVCETFNVPSISGRLAMISHIIYKVDAAMIWARDGLVEGKALGDAIRKLRCERVASLLNLMQA